jgi:hypothetical protein
VLTEGPTRIHQIVLGEIRSKVKDTVGLRALPDAKASTR